MEPRYRGRTHNKRFQPPRRVDSQSQESGPSTSASSSQVIAEDFGNDSCTGGIPSAESSCKTLPVVGPCGNIADQFDSDSEELEKEMVEQSSDQSIHLLSVLGGFQSAAAAARQNSMESSVSHFTNSPKTNGLDRIANTNRGPAKKPWAKDPTQSSIMKFVSASGPSSSSASSLSISSSGSCSTNGGGNQSHVENNRSTTECQEGKIQYGTPSKMYSPIKKVSDTVYVISDDSSGSPDKPSGSSSAHSDLAKSVSKNLFSSFATQKKPTATSSGALSNSTRGRGKKPNTATKRKSSAGNSSRQKGKSKADSSQRTFSLSSSSLSFMNVDFDDSDNKDFVDIPASIPPSKQEVEVGKTYGLLNDSKVTTVKENYFEKLPLDVIENIFCGLPMLDLCLTTNRVCLAWNEIISSDTFIPWKKTYHKLKLGESSAKDTVHKIMAEEDMKMPSLRLLNLISYMQKLKRVDPHNNACELLKQHPKYTWALALLQEKAPHCIRDKEPNPWSLMCAMVMVAATVQDLHTTLKLLMSPRSHLMCLEVLECFYCIATFLLAFKMIHLPPMGNRPESANLVVNLGGGKKSSVVNGMHYRLFYALYLYENTSVSNHAMLQEAMPSSSGQQSIVKYSRGDTAVRLTHEQMRIIKYTPDASSGEVVKIFAFAGSGKTTTLVRYAQMRPNLKFLLIVFNKSVCNHAQATFPRNVTCKTGHGLAFGAVGRRYAAAEKLHAGNLRVYEVSYALKAREKHKENQYIRAKFVIETLKKYMSSDDEDITTLHVPTERMGDNGQKESIPHDARMRYASDATDYWNRMKKMEDKGVRMTHDGYLKLWQLYKPELKQYDIILVDEAQDLTPALLDVVQRQSQPRIFVGDQHQQIYAFRGAVNAMQGVQADRVFYLTQSFRFGPEIAQVANTILEVLKDEHRKTIAGHSTPDTINGGQIGQLAVLCRSNFTVFAEAVKVCVYSDQPVRIAFVGGLEGFGLSMLMDVYTLMLSTEDKKKDGHEIQNQFIKRFQNLADLEKYAEKTLDNELMGKIRIVKTYHHNLPQCLHKIREKAVSNVASADVVFSTVHKAKGLEFSTVKITDDFIDLHDILRVTSIEKHMMQGEEANLLYVAVTRAKRALIMSKTVRTLLSRVGGGCYQPILTEKLVQDGVSLTFKPQALTLYRSKVTLSSKEAVRAGLLSPELISNMGSEYAHLFGKGFEKTEMEDEEDILIEHNGFNIGIQVYD
ncbi:hypothetical protein V1264_020153 [Littorina saxatilis]|uniref:DNA 3'-5' helicase n=2 Tax=Littorina saxatilis TaxID=31220 RepID=A0AAN9BC02_9CAEN